MTVDFNPAAQASLERARERIHRALARAADDRRRYNTMVKAFGTR